jgi:hypothetical protein
MNVKSYLIAAMVAAATMTTTQAKAAPWVYGAGSMNCQKLLDDTNKFPDLLKEMNQWILGYWSGVSSGMYADLNAHGKAAVDAGGTNADITFLVWQNCVANPSWRLDQATGEALINIINARK